MMHQIAGGIGGSAADISIQIENMLHVKRTMHERIAFHTGRTVEEIARDADRDRWFTAAEAREYGIIDEIVADAGQLVSAGQPGGTP